MFRYILYTIVRPNPAWDRVWQHIGGKIAMSQPADQYEGIFADECRAASYNGRYTVVKLPDRCAKKLGLPF